MRKIIADFADERLATLQEFLLEGDPSVAADVLRALAGAIPDRALEFALSVQGRESKELQLQIGTIVENLTADIPLDVLAGMLDSPSLTTRMAILERIIEVKEKGMFEPVSEYFLTLVRSGAEDDECDAVGRALVASDIDAAGPLLISWIKPGGLFGRMIELPGQKYLHWAAVTGLSQVPGKKAEKVIKWLSKRAGDKVHAHCMRALVKRRRSGLSDG